VSFTIPDFKIFKLAVTRLLDKVSLLVEVQNLSVFYSLALILESYFFSHNSIGIIGLSDYTFFFYKNQ